MKEFRLRNFNKGTITAIEAESIPEEASSGSLNWLTKGDKIELSGGYSLIGTEVAGAGRITGLEMLEKVDGTLLPVRTRGKMIEYYTNDWNEAGTNLLGDDADGEDTTITAYTSLAGYQGWISSPNSGLYKMMLANPESTENLYVEGTNFRGYITASEGRLLLWNDSNYLYGSSKDVQNSTVYTSVSAEAVGALGSTNYTGTLASLTGYRTGFNVVFTDGTLIVTDDKNGNLIGDVDPAGTNTVNYTTGVFNVTFSGTTTGAVTVNYDYEDSTVNGLADFGFTSPTRSANEGFFVSQPTGGDIISVEPFEGDYYCLHKSNAWLFSIDAADTTVTNQIYRRDIGMPFLRAAAATDKGIYYIDMSNESEPRFKLITTNQVGDRIDTVTVSLNFDMTNYKFDTAVAYRWGDYLLLACSTSDYDFNNRVIAFNTVWESFDVLDYRVSVMRDKDGVLWAGDSIANNTNRIFYTYSAGGGVITNYWEGRLTQLQVDEIKKFKRLTIKGEIQSAQTLEVYLAFDGGDYTLVGEIDGTGDEVDTDDPATIGSAYVGSEEIGGTTDTVGVEAFPYVKEFSRSEIDCPKFDEVKIKFIATGVGYVSVSEVNYFDIKTYGQKNVRKYRYNY